MKARTEAACLQSALNGLYNCNAMKEYRPSAFLETTAASVSNGQPPEGSGMGWEADHGKTMRMAGNGGTVSRPEEWFAAIAFALVFLGPVVYIMFFGEVPA